MFFILKNWRSMTVREKQACYMVLCCVLCVLLTVALCVGLTLHVLPGQTPLEPADTSYDPNAASINTQTYNETILPKSEDAGESYFQETVFVGDSNTVRMYFYSLIALENYMATEGLGIEGVETANCVYFADGNVEPIPRAIQKVQPRRIVMMLGTNNADGVMSTESFIKTYRSAVKAIQSAYPYCDILISAIPPIARVTAYPNLSQNNIDKMNLALVALAEELQLKFLNVAEVLKGKDGYAPAGNLIEDGLHMTKSTLKQIIDYVRTHPYLTEDKRPPLTKIPARKEAPASVITPMEPESVPPAAAPAPPVVDSAPPVVDSAPPVVDSAPPVVNPAPPVVDSTPPVVDSAPPVVDSAPPVVDSTPPVAESPPPIADAVPPSV